MFSFPPDKGNVGTAAYLNVFGSIHKVLKVGRSLSQNWWCQSFTTYNVPTFSSIALWSWIAEQLSCYLNVAQWQTDRKPVIPRMPSRSKALSEPHACNFERC